MSEDIERFSYNTAIAKLMEANNALVDKYNEVSKEDMEQALAARTTLGSPGNLGLEYYEILVDI